MTIELTPTIRLLIAGSKVNTTDKERAAVTLSEAISFALTDGLDDGEVDLLWSDTRSVAAGASDDIDLSGALTDPSFGADCDFAFVKGIIIYSTSALNERLEVGGDGANGFTTWLGAAGDTVYIQPGGMLTLIAPNDGYEVTADTGDILRVTAGNVGSDPSTYDVWLLGVSALGS